jgi:hypothetical protein
MYDYNSHDYHVMMMVFLTIAIRAIKPVHIKVTITRLCYFFNTISVTPQPLRAMQLLLLAAP